MSTTGGISSSKSGLSAASKDESLLDEMYLDENTPQPIDTTTVPPAQVHVNNTIDSNKSRDSVAKGSHDGTRDIKVVNDSLGSQVRYIFESKTRYVVILHCATKIYTRNNTFSLYLPFYY